jgi:hypothetical protein
MSAIVKKEKKRQYDMAWRQKNLERIKSQSRAYYHSHQVERRQKYLDNKAEINAKCRAYYRRNKSQIRNQKLVKTFGITQDAYNEMFLMQNGVCAICKQKGHRHHGIDSLLYVDHCHDTGTIRALLCGRCNKGIGLFLDNPEFLREAADYVVRHSITAMRGRI